MQKTIVVTSKTQLTGKTYTNIHSHKMNLISSALLGGNKYRVGVRRPGFLSVPG